MARHLCRLAVGCAGALVVLCVSTSFASNAADRTTSAHPPFVTPLRGVNIPAGGLPEEVDRHIAVARALHAKIVRANVSWSALEPLAPGQLDREALASLDRLMTDAAAAGIRVIATVDSSPCWASSAPAPLLRACVPGEASRANAWPPGNPASYATFVAYLAQRYGTHLAAIEIWNEPDQANQLYFAGPNKAVRYAALLRAAYPAIKQANPHVTVLGGSLVGSNGVFLRALYAAGIKGYYDALAVHFYYLPLASLRSFREVQLAHGDTKPLWLDEFGWSSCWPRYRIQQEQACVTPKTQAVNITNLFRALARTGYVAAETLYDLQGSLTEDFGVLNEAGAHKPSFGALARALASPFGPLSPVTLNLGRRDGDVLASGSGPVGDYMQLEAFEGDRLRYRALFVLDRFNRYSIALPPALDASALRVRVYQEWTGPSEGAERDI